jgi:hypothetical protein
MNKDRFNKAAQSTVNAEIEAIEKRIMRDLAGMIIEAHNCLADSKIFDRFKTHLNGRKPGPSDVQYLKRLIEVAVDKNDPSFSKYLEVIVERDPVNKSNIGYEFKVKSSAFR